MSCKATKSFRSNVYKKQGGPCTQSAGEPNPQLRDPPANARMAERKARKSRRPGRRGPSRAGSQFRKTPFPNNRVSGPLSSIGLDAIHNSQNDVCHPTEQPEKSKERKDKEDGRRRLIGRVSSMSAAKNSGKHGKKENHHPANEHRHVTKLPDQTLQRMKFHKAVSRPRIFLDTEL